MKALLIFISFTFQLLIYPFFLTPLVAQNKALDFDGSDDQISISYSSSLDVSDQVTIEAWVKPSRTDWQTIWMKGSYGYGLALTGSSTSCQSSLKLAFWDQGACASAILSTGTYINNEWNHVAVTVVDNGSNLTIYFYINGVEDGPHTSSQTAISNGGSSSFAYISRQGSTCDCNFMDGAIDELRVWNDVRTQAEIKANMHTELSGSESNLVAYYNFNDGSGTTPTDLTSNSNDGTMANMDASSDWVSNTLFAQDYSLELDGTDDYVLITENSAFKPTSALTLSAWIYINDWSNSDYYTPISITQSGGYAFYLHTDDKLYFYIDAGGSYVYPSKDVSSVSSGWHHVAGTFDGRYAKLYWDGALAETIDNGSTVSINYGTANLIFGAEPTSSGISAGYYHTGKIDEVRIWDDVRTQAEIQDNMYKELVGNESNLVAYYNFNDGRGTSVLDLTSNDNNGTMTNMDASSDWTNSKILGTSISGNSGFRMLSSPVSGQV